MQGYRHPIPFAVPCACRPINLERERLRRLMDGADIPADLQGRTFDTFDTSLAPQQFERAVAWANGIIAGTLNHSLMLYGKGKGQGKTHLAAAAANMIVQHKPALFVVGPDMADQVIEQHDQAARLVSQMIGAPVLFVDDLGQADDGQARWKKSATQQLWFRVLNAREQGGRPICVTSNLASPADFMKSIGDAGASRLFGMCGRAGAVEFKGINDYRLRDFMP